MRLTEKDRSNLFWYLVVPSLSIITLFISLSPWFFELIATPVGRVFTGINRWSGDYFTYLSYVELGRRGYLGAKLLAITDPQPTVFAHLAHTIPGYVFGHLLGLSSVISYHLARAIYGIIFIVLSFVFFYKISRNRTIASLAFITTFYLSGFIKLESLNPLKISRYLSWLQEQNIIGRTTGPLHYNAGFIFFILTFLWFFRQEKKIGKKIIIMGLLLNLILLSNPFAYLIIGLTFALYSIFDLKNLKVIFPSFLLTLPLLIYNQQVLSVYPWGPLGNSPKYYQVLHPPLLFWDLALSIGPTFFLGIFGIIYSLIADNKKIGTESVKINLFLIIWFFVQFCLFFFGDFVRVDPLRSFNGLYYLPLSYFAVFFLYKMTKNIKQIIIILIFLFIITAPSYYLVYKEQLMAFTDFKSFSTFTFPTKKQVEAFSFLEKNTPTTSGVLALYEASSLIIGFSGNSAGVNMDQKLKLPFYINQLTDKQAKDFLNNNHFQYVYFGYQEKSVGGNMSKYSFLKKVYENEEVTIFKVL